MTQRRRTETRGPRVAEPTITEARKAYVAGRPARRRREAGIALQPLESFLDGYAYESLAKAEARRFDRLFNAEGPAHCEYCEMFGPKKIVPELRHFFGWFLIRKVMAPPEDLRWVAEETGRFIAWLGEQGHVTPKAAAEGLRLAAEAADVLPRAEEAAHLLARALARGPKPTGDVIDGQFRVARLAPGKLWLESWEDGETYGPLAVPAKAAERLEVEWELSGAVGKVGRKWVLLEVWNVYPAVG